MASYGEPFEAYFTAASGLGVGHRSIGLKQLFSNFN
jgi:hypothetical protein